MLYLYLLRNRLLRTRNHFRDISRETYIKIFLAIFLGGLFVAGDYVFFLRILRNIKSAEIGGLEMVLMVRLMTMVFLAFLSMLIFSNIITSISTTYLSDDLELLLSSPVPIRSIAGIKLTETILNSSWLVILAGVPIFIAYGKIHDAPFWYYGWIFLVLLPFLVLPAAVGTLVTMFLMRFFPAKRLHQIMTILGALFIATLIILFRLMKPEQLVRPIGGELLAQFLLKMRIPSKSYLPSTWATEAIATALEHNYSFMMRNWTYLMLSAAVSVVVVMVVASKIYFPGWSGSKESKLLKTHSQGYRGKESRFFHWWFSDIHQSTRSLLMKDTKVFFRDTSQWSQLLMLGALIILYLFNIKMLPFKTFDLQNAVSFINLALSNLVMAGVAVRFLFPAVSLEGKCFWIIHSAPISYRRFIWEKFFLFIIPLIVLGELISLVSNLILDVDAYMMTLSIITNCAIVLGLAGLGVGMGAMFPKFNADNPAEIAVGIGGILYMIFSLLFIGIITACLARPVWVHYYQPRASLFSSGWDVFMAYAIALILCMATTFIPMIIGEKQLAKQEL